MTIKVVFGLGLFIAAAVVDSFTLNICNIKHIKECTGSCDVCRHDIVGYRNDTFTAPASGASSIVSCVTTNKCVDDDGEVEFGLQAKMLLKQKFKLNSKKDAPTNMGFIMQGGTTCTSGSYGTSDYLGGMNYGLKKDDSKVYQVFLYGCMKMESAEKTTYALRTVDVATAALNAVDKTVKSAFKEYTIGGGYKMKLISFGEITKETAEMAVCALYRDGKSCKEVNDCTWSTMALAVKDGETFVSTCGLCHRTGKYIEGKTQIAFGFHLLGMQPSFLAILKIYGLVDLQLKTDAFVPVKDAMCDESLVSRSTMLPCKPCIDVKDHIVCRYTVKATKPVEKEFSYEICIMTLGLTDTEKGKLCESFFDKLVYHKENIASTGNDKNKFLEVKKKDAAKEVKFGSGTSETKFTLFAELIKDKNDCSGAGRNAGRAGALALLSAVVVALLY